MAYPFEELGLEDGPGAEEEGEDAGKDDEDVDRTPDALGRAVRHGRAHRPRAVQMLGFRDQADEELAVLSLVVKHELEIESVAVRTVQWAVGLEMDGLDGEEERRLNQGEAVDGQTFRAEEFLALEIRLQGYLHAFWGKISKG